MAHPLTPATSKTSTTAVKGYVVGGPLPIQIPPHHEMAFEKASVEEDEHGKYVCIPLVNTDPFGFERKRREYKCKYCHTEQVSLSAWDALGNRFLSPASTISLAYLFISAPWEHNASSR